MEPRVRYVCTPDGIDIAYWAVGTGPAIVFPPSLVSHVGLEWSTARGRLYESLSQHCTIVRFDGRAQGMSSGSPNDITAESPVIDFDAVVDRLELERFSVFGHDCSGPVSIRYAAERPERVSHLILWHALPRLSDYFLSPLVETLLPLIESNWVLYTQTMIRAYAGWPKSQDPSSSAQLFRASMSPETYKAFIEKAAYFDATDYLGKVGVPTLVLHRRDYDSTSPSVSAGLAQDIPSAIFTLVDGSANFLGDESPDDGIDAVESFLGLTSGARTDKGQSTGLSPREEEVLGLLAAGLHNREMSEQLGLSVHTVERHIANIYAKIGARSRVEAAAFAMNHDLVFANPFALGVPKEGLTRELDRVSKR